MDIASVIVTLMVTCRVLARFILDNRSEQRLPVAQLCLLVSPLEATLTRFPASVHSKRLTAKLNPLEATLTKKQGGPSLPRACSARGHYLPSSSRCRSCCCPVGAPLFFNGKCHLSLFSLYRYPALSIQTRGGTPPPPSLLYAVLRFPVLGQLRARRSTMKEPYREAQ